MSRTYARPPPLPPKSPSAASSTFKRRSARLSLNDYQSLALDRDALQAAYRDSLVSPGLSTTSQSARNSYIGKTTSGTTTSVTHQSSSNGLGSEPANKRHTWSSPPSTATDHYRYPLIVDHGPSGMSHSGSTLSQHLKPGDNPHEVGSGNLAGVGAGNSPITQAPIKSVLGVEQKQNGMEGNGNGVDGPPALPERPKAFPMLAQAPSANRPPALPSRPTESMDIDQEGISTAGAQSAIAGPSSSRALPSVPTNVPVPDPPAWEPDYKSHIPASLTAPSIQHAYAQLSAPPPGLAAPPRRVQPYRQASAAGRLRTSPTKARAPSAARPGKIPTPASAGEVARPATRSLSTSFAGQPMTAEPAAMSPTSPVAPTAAGSQAFKPARAAEEQVTLVAKGRTPIWSTHYIDPFLRSSQAALNVPPQLTNVTNIALTSMSSGPKTRYNTTTGAPIDGVAKAAKDLLVKPDARFVAEDGAIEAGLGVVDAIGSSAGPQRDSPRKRARVEISSKAGGIKFDLREIDSDRQVDVTIASKSGDVLVLLPEDFIGPLHITSASKPKLMPILLHQCQNMAHPYATFYTTFVTPLKLSSTLPAEQLRQHSAEHRVAQTIERYVPGSMGEQSDMMDQVVGGFASHSRGEHSKVHIKTKGRVAIGYRKTKDEDEANRLGLNVGVEGGKGTKKKKWWQG